MKLVSENLLSDWQRQHAWACEQARDLVRQAMLDRQSVEGLDELRAGLPTNLDSEVLDRIERGEWWLVKPEADYVEWTMPEGAFDPKIIELLHNPPAQPKRSPRLFRLVDSVTGERLAQRDYLATVKGDTAPRRTDGKGIAHLFIAAEVQQISMKIIGV
ncbi:hypothetical protein ACYZT9_03890 [Pseudomonas sp. ZT5P21]